MLGQNRIDIRSKYTRFWRLEKIDELKTAYQQGGLSVWADVSGGELRIWRIIEPGRRIPLEKLRCFTHGGGNSC
jgi:hypothetical protein